MARTFVRVELVEGDDSGGAPFWSAMQDLGFSRTLRGKTSRQTLRLPDGMYLIEKTTPIEALALTREAARTAHVEARIFCMPVAKNVRFGNLLLDATAEAA